MRSKHTIAEFTLADGSYIFDAGNTGKYIIAVAGGFSVKADNVFSVFSKCTGEQLEIKKRLPYTSFE